MTAGKATPLRFIFLWLCFCAASGAEAAPPDSTGGPDLSARCLSAYAEASRLIERRNTGLDWYRLTSAAASEMRREMGEKGPSDIYGKIKDAFTDWSLRWKFLPEGSPAPTGCSIDYRIKITLPCWLPENQPEASLKKAWDDFFSAIVTHENNHVVNFETHLREIEAAVAKGPLLPEKANEQIQGIVDRIKRADRRYDEQTNSGRKEGVKFP